MQQPGEPSNNPEGKTGHPYRPPRSVKGEVAQLSWWLKRMAGEDMQVFRQDPNRPGEKLVEHKSRACVTAEMLWNVVMEALDPTRRNPRYNQLYRVALEHVLNRIDPPPRDITQLRQLNVIVSSEDQGRFVEDLMEVTGGCTPEPNQTIKALENQPLPGYLEEEQGNGKH